jgi:hypothetical protein|tara:strand:- start:273 stop:545 length:273 start_codon:yes stop_codon:yes gene_type:complete
MAAQNARQVKYETDLEVLKVELRNLAEKVDYHTKTTQAMMREFQIENNKQHNDMMGRILKLEQWRWMLIGAGVLLGSSGMMGIEKLLGLH